MWLKPQINVKPCNAELIINNHERTLVCNAIHFSAYLPTMPRPFVWCPRDIHTQCPDKRKNNSCYEYSCVEWDDTFQHHKLLTVNLVSISHNSLEPCVRHFHLLIWWPLWKTKGCVRFLAPQDYSPCFQPIAQQHPPFHESPQHLANVTSLACVASISMRFRSEEGRTRIPFLGLSLLRNQTETTARQAITSWASAISDVLTKNETPKQGY